LYFTVFTSDGEQRFLKISEYADLPATRIFHPLAFKALTELFDCYHWKS